MKYLKSILKYSLIVSLVVTLLPMNGHSQLVGSVFKSLIYGGDEVYPVDVIREDNVNKMLVKATTVPDTATQLVFQKFARTGGSTDMTVNGSSNNVVFEISASATQKTIIREIKFVAFDTGIKVDTFLGLNSDLQNGIIVRLNLNSTTQDFLPIKTTQDFDGVFAFGDGARWELVTASGNDSLVAQFSPREPLVLQQNSSDSIQIIIRDNLNQVGYLEAIAFGLYD